MADLGDLLGSLMSGVIRARRMADEQTAALAEYYKENPLLEGLSVPRIRIPELTIDMPFLIENQTDGETGVMEDPAKLATTAKTQAEAILSKHNIRVNDKFPAMFVEAASNRLATVKQSGAPVMKEAIARSVHDAFSEVATKTKLELTPLQRDAIAKELRAKVSPVGIIKQPVASSVVANIKTADVKEKASTTSVVRLKITLKEEGLEWATRATESGGVASTLQPE